MSLFKTRLARRALACAVVEVVSVGMVVAACAAPATDASKPSAACLRAQRMEFSTVKADLARLRKTYNLNQLAPSDVFKASLINGYLKAVNDEQRGTNAMLLAGCPAGVKFFSPHPLHF